MKVAIVIVGWWVGGWVDEEGKKDEAKKVGISSL